MPRNEIFDSNNKMTKYLLHTWNIIFVQRDTEYTEMANKEAGYFENSGN